MTDTAHSEPMVSVPLELLVSLVDESACRFDHHGGCQEHGYLSLIPGQKCPQAELKERLLAEGCPANVLGMDGSGPHAHCGSIQCVICYPDLGAKYNAAADRESTATSGLPRAPTEGANGPDVAVRR